MESTEVGEKELLQRILQARKVMTRLIVLLRAWLKKSIREASSDELIMTETELMRLVKDNLKTESNRSLSLGKLLDRYTSHPLHKLLSLEWRRRELLLERDDPKAYFGDLHELSIPELKEYFIWKGENHGSINEWRKYQKRTLKVLSNETTSPQTFSGNRSRGPIRGDLDTTPKPETPFPTKEVKAYGPRRKDRKETKEEEKV